MSKNLSISFVYDDSLDGSEGVAQYVKNLGDWLRTRGHSVTYLAGQTRATDYEGSRIYSLSRNIKVKFNGNHLSIPLLASSKRINNALQDIKPDIIHIQMPHSPLMGQIVIKRAHKSSTIIGTFHIYPANHLVRLSSRLLRFMYGKKLRLIDQVLSVSLPAQQFAKDAFGIESIVVPNMVNVSKLKNQGPSNTDSNNIVFIGRLVERKGARYLIEAFSLLTKDYPSVKLLIAGDGPDKSSLIDRVNELGIADKVQFLGFVSEQQKKDILNSARIACFPSLYGESFGIVLIEAMAAGAYTVMGGNNPGYQSVLKDPKTLFDPRDVKSFAGKLTYVLQNEQQAKLLHSFQQNEYKQYDIEVVGSTIEKIYYQQIAKTTNRRHN